MSHYVFVSSAGAYNANDMEPMHIEGDVRKPSAGHCEVEAYLKSANAPYTIFHPLYIYGPHTAKDCEQWFIDRIIRLAQSTLKHLTQLGLFRDRPVPLPAPGIQMTSLSHVEDVASMLATVPGNSAAVQQEFNICSDRCISFEGSDPKYRWQYRKASRDCPCCGRCTWKGAKDRLLQSQGTRPQERRRLPFQVIIKPHFANLAIPCRTVHFFASSDKAKAQLKWSPKHSFTSDVQDLCNAYTSSDRANKDIDFSVDDKILAALSAPV